MIITTKEIKEHYGHRLVKAFHNIVFLKNYTDDEITGIEEDIYSVIAHPNKLYGLYKDYESANKKFNDLVWAAKAKSAIILAADLPLEMELK